METTHLGLSICGYSLLCWQNGMGSQLVVLVKDIQDGSCTKMKSFDLWCKRGVELLLLLNSNNRAAATKGIIIASLWALSLIFCAYQTRCKADFKITAIMKRESAAAEMCLIQAGTACLLSGCSKWHIAVVHNQYLIVERLLPITLLSESEGGGRGREKFLLLSRLFAIG